MLIGPQWYSVVTGWYNFLFSNTPRMAALEVHGKVFGKESSCTPPSKLRAILPQDTDLSIGDYLFAARLNRFIDFVLPVPPGCFVGARPKTQAAEIGHSLKVATEKILDDHSKGCICEADIMIRSGFSRSPDGYVLKELMALPWQLLSGTRCCQWCICQWARGP